MSRPRKYATTSEAEIRALVAEGLKFPEIAKRLNVQLGVLRTAASLLGIKSPCNYGGVAKVDFEQFVSGKTIAEIAAARGVSRQSVHLGLARAKLPSNSAALVKYLLAEKKAA
jgi:hypothetical protein